jgi:hypothetical protein
VQEEVNPMKIKVVKVERIEATLRHMSENEAL